MLDSMCWPMGAGIVTSCRASSASAGEAHSIIVIARTASLLILRPFFCLAARLGLVQGHGGANERLQRFLVDLLAFAEVDGAPRVSLETRVEETGSVIQR